MLRKWFMLGVLATLMVWLGAGSAGASLGSGQFCSLDKQSYYKRHGYICKIASNGRYRLFKYHGGGSPKPKPRPTRPNRPATDPPGCTKPRKVVRISLSIKRYPAIFRHIRRAVRRGFPRITRIHRAGADTRRRKALAGIPTKQGFDRDEWPMAMARKTWRTDVMYVPVWQNRSAGAIVGAALREHCDGTRFTIVR